ncbi:hypothetical protein EDC04DRAFT_3150353 [Pisolithus marmoratus]|nr:hypothetical protein EDC04DRAFT_3150353 [Pisolithus marmoratus]
MPGQHECDHSEVTSTSILANTAAVEEPAVVLDKCTEITYGPTAPEAAIIDVQNQVAGSCADSSNEHKGDYTGTATMKQTTVEGRMHTEEVMQQCDSQPEWVTAGEMTLNASDIHHKPGRVDSITIPNDCAEIPTGHQEPKMEIIDVQHVEGNLLVNGIGAVSARQPDKYATAPEAPDKSSQCILDGETATGGNKSSAVADMHNPLASIGTNAE